jgi:hypothetical protein
MDVHTWRSTNAQAEARWLNYLAGTGYPLSAIEHTVIDNAAAASDDSEDQPSTAESPGGQASTDETAA